VHTHSLARSGLAAPPRRAARLEHYPVKAILNQQPLLRCACRKAKPPTHRRIEAVLDQRSHPGEVESLCNL
jgi:hypothetical protein